MTEDDVRQVFRVLGAEYGSKVVVTPDRIKVWQYVLGHATVAEVQTAILNLMSRDGKFPPSVGDVNQAVLAARGGTKEDWGTLWDTVMRAASRSLYYAEEEAKKLAPEALAAIGGVPGLKELAASNPDQLGVLRAQFRQRLEAKQTTQKDIAVSDQVRQLLDQASTKRINHVQKEK